MTKKDKNKESNEMDEKIQNEKNLKDEVKQADETTTKILEEKDQQIEALKIEVEEYKDKVLRKAAEFENYKRRTENDQLNLLKYAGENVIIKLLPAIDDLERSLQHMDKAKDVDAIKKGIQLVYDKTMKALEDQGVKAIESVGQPFNVDFHEALMQRRDDNVPSHTVLDEVEKGYMYKDRVIRHAKVIVSEELSDEVQNNTTNENSNKSDEGK